MRISFDATFKYLQPSLPRDAIRVGNKGDGGYVVSLESVLKADILLSFGMGEDFSFESHFHEINRQSPICTYDHTVPVFNTKFLLRILADSIIARKPSLFKRKFSFYREYHKFFTNIDNHRHARERITDCRFRTSDKPIDEIFAEFPEGNVFIKMDIEGDEYKILDDVIALESRLCGLVVEFHNAGTHYNEFRRLINSLTKFMSIDHFHINNYEGISKSGFPQVIEMSFSNKNLKVDRDATLKLPIPHLDFQNTQRNQDYSVEWV